MSKHDFGVYSLIFTNIIPVISAIMLFGLNVSFVRNFSGDNIEKYKWRKHLHLIAIVWFFISALSTILIIHIYNLPHKYAAILAVALVANTFLLFLASIFRSREKFNLAIIIERFHSIVFLAMIVFVSGIMGFNID